MVVNIMLKYKKFVFQDLLKSAVVNSHHQPSVNDGSQEQIINTAIVHHLQATIGGKQLNGSISSAAEDYADSEDSSTLDLEEQRQEAYSRGLDDAKARYQPIIDGLQSDRDFAQLLEQKLTEIISFSTIDEEVAKLAAQIITSIAQKIYLIVPIDFEKILRLELLPRLRNFYKDGEIKLNINPDRYSFCTSILQSEYLPIRIKENLQIIQDEKINVNDCKLEWSNTCLEYNQEQLSVEIKTILKQLQSTT